MTVAKISNGLEPDHLGKTRFASRHQSYRDHDAEEDRKYSLKSLISRARTWTRFLLVFLTLLCLTSTWANILAFNFVMVCTQTSEGEEGNQTADENVTMTPVKGQPLHFSGDQRTYLTSAVAAAALITNFIVTPLISKFGARSIFTFCGCISVVATALMPIGLQSSFIFALALRALQGIAFAASFPVIGAVSARWTYYKQYGLCVSSLVAYVQLAPSFSSPISGALCTSSLGWQSVFYGHALVGCVLFVAFALLYRNTPAKHPLVTRRESTKISLNKCVQSKAEEKKIPYFAILKDPAVWAVWIASIGNFLCVNTVFLYSPTYFHTALGMDVAESGLSSAGPAALEFLLKIICGVLSDKFRCIGETNRLRFFNTVAFFGAAVVLVVLCFVPASSQTLCFLLLTIATALLGFTTGGFFKAGPIIARQYSPFVTGNVSLGLTLTMIFVPFVKHGLAPNDTPEEWNKIFYFMAGSLIVTNVVFCVFCSGDPAEWTKDASGDESITKRAKIAPIETINPSDYYTEEPIVKPHARNLYDTSSLANPA